jgi:chlorobactene glucosyltransferase
VWITWFQLSIAGFLGVTFIIAVGNLYTLRQLGSYPEPVAWPRVSILVPARNEEASIEACVTSLLAQDYPDFEVIVLDDNSEDATGRILAHLAAGDRRLRVLRGQTLPKSWLGKHWACHQLSHAAGGELLFFTDADTRHTPLMLRASVAALLAEGADMLSGLPNEEAGTWAEKLAMPVMMWGIIAFVPLAMAYRLRIPAMATAIGQHMLFRRSAFEAVGGFARVRQEVLDDRALATQIVAAGYRWRLANAQVMTSCRMYHNAQEVFAGYGKNFFATFGGNIPLFVLIWIWLAIAYLEPLGLLLLSLAGVAVPGLAVILAAVAVVFAFFLWTVSDRRFGVASYHPFLYPITIGFTFSVAMYSVISALTGRAHWKGRTLFEPKI